MKNINREMEDRMEMLEVKSTVAEMPLGLLVNFDIVEERISIGH